MLFSIIVPIYNVEKYLRKCVDSILNQTYRDFELLLIDDGSPDHCGTICDEYAAMDRRVKVYHQQNKGLSGARNTGLEHATGEWILFIDSDDWVSADMLEVLKKHIIRNPADVYCFNCQKVSEDENEILEKLHFFVENDSIDILTEKERFDFYRDSLMQYKIGWEVCLRLLRRDIIDRNHLRFFSTDKVFAEDYLFSLSYFMHVSRIGYICNYLYFYRQRANSLLATKRLDSILFRLFRLSRTFYTYSKKQKAKYFLKNFYQLYFHLMNYHVQYSMSEVSLITIQKWMECLCEQKAHNYWMKQIEDEIQNYRRYMVKHKWL